MKNVLQKPADNYEPRGRLDPIGFDRHVRFRTYVPPADLAPFIEYVWTIRWDKAGATYHSEEVMHRPYVDVFVSMQQSGIQGTFRGKRTYVATNSGRIVGIRFRPGAFHAFWDGALADVQDTIMDVQQVFPQTDSRYIEHVLTLDDQAAIHELLQLVRAKHPQLDANIDLINQIIAAIETDESLQTVTAVAKRLAEANVGSSSSFATTSALGSNGCSSVTSYWRRPDRSARATNQIGQRLPMTLATAANNISLRLLST